MDQPTIHFHITKPDKVSCIFKKVTAYNYFHLPPRISIILHVGSFANEDEVKSWEIQESNYS